MCIFLLFNFLSCSKEKEYTQREFVELAKEAFPEVIEVRIPNSEPHRRVLCRDYGEGCVPGTGRRLSIRNIELIAIAFESETYAKAEAERLNQYYSRNWLLDDVAGEPILIDFVQRAYQAKPGRQE